MALILADRVQETCAAPGTGVVTLLGAVTEYQSFSAGIGANNTTYYTIADQSGSNWEVGLGTIGATGLTLTRTTVLSSSNAGALVNFSVGIQSIWCDYPAGKAMYADASGYLNSAGNPYLTFASQATNPTYAAGELWYASDNDSLTFWNGISGNDLHIGQEIQLRVYNTTASTIPAGSAVYITGQHSQFPTVDLAIATSAAASNAIGLTNTAIPVNSYGYVVVLGKFTNLDTHLFTAGNPLFLSATTAGALTNIAPTNPNYIIPFGFCVYSNPSLGVVEITTPLPAVGATNLVGTVPIVSGGTNSTATPTAGGAGYGTGTAHAYTTAGTSGNALISAGASAPSFGNLAIGTANTNISGALTVTNGGTGASTLTGILVGNGTSAITTVTVPSGTIVGTTDTQTLTNKRVTTRAITTSANSATPTINTDNTDIFVITGQSVAITSFTTNLSGTPTNGQKLWIAITGTTAIALTWGASFEASTQALPTTTITTGRLDVGFVWNVATTKWRCVAAS